MGGYRAVCERPATPVAMAAAGSATAAARSRRLSGYVQPCQPQQLPAQRAPRRHPGSVTVEAVHAALSAAERAFDASPPPPRGAITHARAAFESCAAPPITFSDYMAHVARAARRHGCADAGTVAAAALVLARRAARSGEVPMTRLTCHRLGLASFVVAYKAVVDGPQLRSSQWARIGGVTPEDINVCERALLGLLHWRAHVSWGQLCELMAEYRAEGCEPACPGSAP